MVRVQKTLFKKYKKNHKINFFFYQNKGEKKYKGDKEGDNKLFIHKKKKLKIC